MKNRLSLLIAFLMTLPQMGVLIAQDRDLDTLEHSLLWEISHPEIPANSYLFGTIHMIDASKYFLPKGLLSSIDQTNQVVFEIDMRDMNDMSTMMSMMSKVMMNGDTTLKDLLSEAEYGEVQSFFQKKGMPLMFLERMKPLFLSALTSFDEMPQQSTDMSGTFMMNGMKSYEMELTSIAEAADKEIGGVETIEFQLSVFDKISYQEQAQYLLESIRMTDEGMDGMEAITEMYLSQDIEKMASSMSEESGGGTLMETVLLTERNEKWIPIMAKMMKEQPTLFAVGAGHLGGDKGVIRLLRKAGYQVQAVQM